MQGDDIRVRELVELAMQAESRGQSQHAEQLLRQAEAAAPNHPLILNEIARRLLLAGNAKGAYAVLKPAVDANPSSPSLLVNLAAALRGLGRPDEEMAALKVALGAPYETGRFAEATKLFADMSLAAACEEFLTLPAYEVLE